MTQNIKIPLKNLNEATIRELQEKYPEAEVSVELHPDRPHSAMNQDHFWEIIASFDWEQDTDDAILAPAVDTLAKSPIRSIYEFADLLSEKLFQLDQKKYALHLGEDAWSPDTYFSVDNFLYARCCVIANGEAYYNEVLEDPAQMPKDLTFEALLYLAETAYAKKTGKDFVYVPAFPIETYSNKAGWEELHSSMKFCI